LGLKNLLRSTRWIQSVRSAVRVSFPVLGQSSRPRAVTVGIKRKGSHLTFDQERGLLNSKN